MLGVVGCVLGVVGVSSLLCGCRRVLCVVYCVLWVSVVYCAAAETSVNMSHDLKRYGAAVLFYS